MKRLCKDLPNDRTEVPEVVLKILTDMINRVKEKDPVAGVWDVPSDVKSGTVWCDASSLAVEVALEINGTIVEDGTWLRPERNTSHINVAELEAAIEGINLAIRWDMKNIRLITDSATVHGWLKAVINRTHRIKVGGLTEMLTSIVPCVNLNHEYEQRLVPTA